MKTLLILIFSLCLMSCTTYTNTLWQDSTYKENISNFLITEKGEKLVIIGDKYHYIFKLDKNLNNILSFKKRKKLYALFSQFNVDNDNNVTGIYTISFVIRDKNDIPKIQNLGFKRNKFSREDWTFYTYKNAIKGKRYTGNKNKPNALKFNRKYQVLVKEQNSPLKTIKKIFTTPVTVTADGIATVTGYTLAPSLMPPFNNQ